MTDWSALEHAYGSAENVPKLLAEVSAGESKEAWFGLWSCLCHQGSVYSASFAAIPQLLDLARRQPPAERIDPLLLAGAIVGSNDIRGLDARPDALVEPLLPEFRRLTEECLSMRGLDAPTVYHLLESANAFDGEFDWARQLGDLENGGLVGRCPVCRKDLYHAIEPTGCFTTVLERLVSRRVDVRRTPIVPAEVADLTKAAARAHEAALRAGRAEIALAIRHAQGRTDCPACGAHFAIAASVARPAQR